ncbi:hypothetical protein KKH43_04330 [Patescibacteria group bacterium]|nr:hypothetical protein [Patescibacteria group bacterium]
MKKLLTFFIVSFVALCVPLTALGATYSEQTYRLEQGQTLQEDLYVSAQNVYIEGTVEGNVFAAATSVTVDGTIKGTLYTGASSVNINGNVENDLFAAGGTVDVSGTVGGSTYLAGGMITTNPSFKTGTDLFLGAGTADVMGEIGKNLVAGAGDLNVGSEIKGSAYLNVNNSNEADALRIQNKAQIHDNLEYKASQKALIENDAKVGGKTQFTPMPTAEKNQVQTKNNGKEGLAAFSFFAFLKGVVSFLGLLVVALVFVAVFKRKSEELHETFKGAYGKSFGYGLLICILAPVVILFLAITIIGFPLSMILLGFYLILLYLAKVVVAVHIGRLILGSLSKKKPHSLYLASVIGVVIIFVLMIIPFLGWIFKALILIWGIGIMYVHYINKKKGIVKQPVQKAVAKTATKKTAKAKSTKKKTAKKSKTKK